MLKYLLIFLVFLSFSPGFAQNDQLAQAYMDKGEYEKALSTYKELLKSEPGNTLYLQGMVSSYQQLENFQAAEELLQNRLKTSGNNPTFLIELGYNLELQKKQEEANQFYEKAVGSLAEKPAFTYSVAREFEKYSLLDYAIKAYNIGIQQAPEMKYELPLARIYGEKGNFNEMFSTYLDLMEKDPEINSNLVREFDRYITEDPANKANEALRNNLLQRLQKNPSLFYNQLLGWLFVQQKDFRKAFIQEKSIYKREHQDLGRIMQLSIIAKSAGDLDAAKEIIAFIIKETPSTDILLQAKQLLLNMKVETASNNEYSEIEKEYAEVLKEYPSGTESLGIKIDAANFLAFKEQKIKEAEDLLNAISLDALSNFQKAAVKMALGDILVLDEKFNQALIYYSQVGNLVKNDEIAQNALYKVAKTSYYKGDFDWAQTQLKVLKESVTQLIANDAMELSLLIQENSQEDSTHTALKLYAQADLLAYQQKQEQAIQILNKILEEHKGESIEDEALLKQAQLFVKIGEYPKAEANYLKILQFYTGDILADNAAFELAGLYEKLHQPEKAMEFYSRIIFNYPDSIYFVDARKNYRKLRGDDIN
ncbi:MAG: tetratricopeptide repeat protein [Gillisia sp.]